MPGPKTKITNEIGQLIVDRRAAGFTLREIAVWLGAAYNLEISHMGVKAALERAAARAPTADPPPPRRRASSESAPATGSSLQSAHSAAENKGESNAAEDLDAADMALLDRAIVALEEDVATARENSGTQALATLQRLLLDAVDRRRKMRPPAPPTDDRAETLAAGRKAVEKLRALVAAERELLAPPVTP